MENQKMPEYETIRAAVAGEKWAVEKVVDCYKDEIDRLSTVAVRQPDGSTKQEINEDMRQSITKKLIEPIPPLSQKNCISKYSNFAMKSLYPTPAFCSRSVMICNVVVESACIGIPKRINGTVVTVECGRIEFAQKNSLSNFVKSYSGFVGIMKESALHRAQAISTPSNLPG